MSVADKLTKLTTDITSAYNSIQSKGGTIPSHKNTDNLSTAISSIPTDEWKPQPDWWDIDSILANDTENYPCKIIALLRNTESTTTIDRLNADKIKTSDGVEYDTSSTSYSHTWDTTKDKPCSLGYKTRYVIWYFSNVRVDDYNKYVPKNTLYIIAKNINTNKNFNAFCQLPICECIELIDCYFSGNYLFFNNNYNMQKITGVNSNANNLTGSGTGTFQNCYNLKDLDLKCNNTTEYSMRSAFANCHALKTIENLDLESMGIKPNLVRSYWGFGSSAIKTIREINFDNIDTSSANNYTQTFSSLLSLIEVETIGEIKVSGINLSNCVLLSHDTLIRFLNALYDYSSSSGTYTLTLGNTNLAKLTSAEIQIGTDKGWTIN